MTSAAVAIKKQTPDAWENKTNTHAQALVLHFS
jgi:hypothetical protein